MKFQICGWGLASELGFFYFPISENPIFGKNVRKKIKELNIGAYK